MRINDPAAYRAGTELELIATWRERHGLELAGRRVLELGCGAARMTRALAERFVPARLVATEVDRIQHEKNLATAPPGVTFRLGGAERIDDPPASYDCVLLFKSLHHVPPTALEQALREIHRVLRPGGLLYVSEPVYWGDFNELMRRIHDERDVRAAAFQALVAAVEGGLFEPLDEVFLEIPATYASWEDFAARFLDVTHTELAIDPPRREAIRMAFLRHMTPSGAHFGKPHRIDLLRRA